MKVVLKITGKVFSLNNTKVLREVANIIRLRYEEGDKLAVVCGGGSAAREYISMGKELGLNNSMLDILGIESSRLNALLLSLLLNDISYTPIPRSISEFLNAWSTGKVVVLGGLQPGQSTNAVAALVAELIGAHILINATVVDGIYDRDPKEYPNARLLRKVRIDELESMINQKYLPGHYELLDPIALSILRRSKIKVVFTNIFKPSNISRILSGDESIGTWIVYRT